MPAFSFRKTVFSSVQIFFEKITKFFCPLSLSGKQFFSSMQIFFELNDEVLFAYFFFQEKVGLTRKSKLFAFKNNVVSAALNNAYGRNKGKFGFFLQFGYAFCAAVTHGAFNLCKTLAHII